MRGGFKRSLGAPPGLTRFFRRTTLARRLGGSVMIGDFVTLDERFGALVPERGSIQMLHNQGTFTEGPVWFGDLQMLFWSDIMSNRMLRWTPDGQGGVFRGDSRHANGNTRDREGRLVTCEHSRRRVTRTEADGRITVIADAHQGRKLNSPNDVVGKDRPLDLVHRPRVRLTA